MEDLLYDIHIAQAMADQAAGDGNSFDFRQTLYFASVLEKHGVTKADFDSSLVYYYIRADRFSDMYKHVAKRLSEDAMELGATEGEVNRYAKFNASGDTTDIWAGKLAYMLVPYAPYNRVDFVLKADTSFRKGDSFLFIIDSHFIYQSGTRSAQACIAMKYDNDTIVNRNGTLSSSGITELRVPANGDHQVKEIRGYIYLAPQKEVSTTLKLMAIKNVQLIKFRRKQAEADELKKDSVGIRKLEPIDIDTLKTKTR